MTLAVDCEGSEFSLLQPQPSSNVKSHANSDIIALDKEIYAQHFRLRNFSAAIFEDLDKLGEGLIIFQFTGNEIKIHIRSTIQESTSVPVFVQTNYRALQIAPIFPMGVTRKVKRILQYMNISPSSGKIKAISMGKLERLIEKMDGDLNLTRFKFGISFLGRFDTSESQMLENTIADLSPDFNNFISKLGDEINLKGWQSFSGGLDVSEEELTGKRALYQQLDGNEIIFHVTPWLPSGSTNEIERKRHFGNDTIVVIFSESLYSFEMKSLLSRQIQVVVFVRFLKRLGKYQLHVFSKKQFGFELPSNPFFIDENENLNFFINYLVKIEGKVYKYPPYAERIIGMRDYYLRDIINKY